jgi:ABC-2 type transport system permease protein
MGTVWTFVKREYGHYFVSPSAYVVAVLFLSVLSFIFIANIQPGQPPDATGYLGVFVTIMLFIGSVFTMRLFAEEQKNGSLELLFTSPVQPWQAVLGKWLGAWLFCLTILALTLIYPIVMLVFGNPDTGLIASAYLGTALVVGALLAFGVLASTLTENVVVAAIIGLVISLMVWLLGIIPQAMPSTFPTAPDWLLQFTRYIDFPSHFYNTFMKGTIDTVDIAYYCSLIILALYLANRVVESRRWR